MASVLFVSAHATAEAPPPLRVELDYQVDPALTDCPTSGELSRAIAAQLAADPFATTPAPAPHRVKAAIQRRGTGTEAHFEWLDPRGNSEGERRLTSESPECAEIARGLSFAIAVQIQLRASAEAPPAPPPRAATPPPTSPPKPPAPPRPPRQRVVMVGAGVLAQHGLTPDVSPGLRVFGSLGNGRVSLEVSTQATLPSEWRTETTREPPAPHPSFTARELSARLAPCFHHSVAGLCAVGMVGQLHVRGEGVDQVQSPSAVVAGAGLRAQLLWTALPSFGALIQGEALALLTPRTVVLNRRGVWSTAPIMLSASVDLAAIFR